MDPLPASIAASRRFYINALPLSISASKLSTVASLEECCKASCRQSATISAAVRCVDTWLTHGEYAASDAYWWCEVKR
jgi:hypothetical protein